MVQLNNVLKGGDSMPDIEFFQTPMGKKHYTYDFPLLVKAINRLALAIEESTKEKISRR